jgi:hypothetical protein
MGKIVDDKWTSIGQIEQWVKHWSMGSNMKICKFDGH